MAKISANYEVVYIIDPAQGEEAIAATVAKFQTLAEQNGSDVVVDECKRHGIRVIDIPERDARSFPCGNSPQRTIVYLEVCEHDRQSRLVGLRAIAGEYHQPIRSSESNASVIDLRRSVSVEEERLHVG